MKKKILFILFAIIFLSQKSRSQNIGVNNPAPDASALWDMVSTDKGVLIPRMTSAQRNGITSPATGLLVYDNTLNMFYYFNGTAWQPIGGNPGWSLTGDAGTSPATNFLGTIDNQSLLIKVNNVMAGFLDNQDGTFLGRNTFLGKSAGFNNTVTGYDNTFIGAKAGYSNTIGTLNTAIGAKALQNLTTGFSNIAIGREAMQLCASGWQNTAVGTGALQNATTGSWNNAFGYLSMRQTVSAGVGNNAFGTETLFNNTGQFNSAFGQTCMRQNTSGSYNSAFGSSALYNNTTGSNNVAMGDVALVSNTTGTNNTAIGFRAAYSAVTAGRIVAIGDSTLFANLTSENVAVGSRAMKNNTTGSNNSAFGSSSLILNSSGNYNNAFGYNSMPSNTTGSNNVAFGYNTLTANTAGPQNTAIGNYAGDKHPSYTNCTFVGYQADANSSGYSNSTALGYMSQVTASNQVKIGNSFVTSIGGYASWTTFPSDARFKTDVKENVPGLTFINELRPVTYHVNVSAINRNLNLRDSLIDKEALSDKQKILYTGFIAQEVEAAAKKSGYDFSGIEIPGDENGIYGIRYADFVVPLVKAVQELSSENAELKKAVAELAYKLNNHKGSLTVEK